MTQKQQILEHLLSGRGITLLESIKLYGIIRLPARITELRQEGWNIQTDRVGPSGIARYSLPSEQTGAQKVS